MPDKTYCYDGSEVLINKLNSEYEDSQKYNVIFKEKIKKMNQAD